ncbi:protease Do-like 8, chloroplastic isoform X1 [Fagus crenata]
MKLVLAISSCKCNNSSWPLQFQSHHAISLLGRRHLCFDGMSSIVCSSHSHNDSPSDAVPSQPPPISTQRSVSSHSKNLERVVCSNIPVATRRMMFASLFVYSCYHPSRYYLSAQALGDPSVTIEEVTPPVFPSGSLFPVEERIVQLFEKNTYSVVNIFDVTLRPQLNATGVVEVPEGNGSGVVWDGQGHIVTNYHVIGNALSKNPSPGQVVARVNILASEGVIKNFEGKLIGADRAKDLAVLKVEASEDLIRPIKVGQSSSLRVGQQCLAIGNPFGFDHTLTVGVISGLNRDIFSQTGVTIGGGVQTDAAINPGNSGGPLLDSKGKLIGINTAIFTQTGTSAGVGFAIPSSTVTKIVPQLIQFGKVARAGLNVEIAPDLVANQLNVRNGALILLVPGNSLAAKAGLQPTTRGFAGNIILGDIIVAVDNKSVKNKAELYKVWDDYNVGDKVVLKILRGSEYVELPIVLEEKSL